MINQKYFFATNSVYFDDSDVIFYITSLSSGLSLNRLLCNLMDFKLPKYKPSRSNGTELHSINCELVLFKSLRFPFLNLKFCPFALSATYNHCCLCQY